MNIRGSDKRASLNVEALIALLTGFLLLFVGPRDNRFLVTFVGIYRLTYFEFFSIFVIILGLTAYGLRIKRYEALLFLSLFLIFISRIVSLLANLDSNLLQYASIIRYFVSTICVIYIFSWLFSKPRNRTFFIYGLSIAVAVETIGGLIIFVASRGVMRGHFLNLSILNAQLFLISVFLLYFAKGKGKLIGLFLSSILICAILATMKRVSLLALFTQLIIILIYLLRYKKRLLKLVSLISVVIFLATISWNRLPEWMVHKLHYRVTKEWTLKTSSLAERLQYAQMCFNAFKEYPIVGVGTASFKGRHKIFLDYIDKPTYQEFVGGSPHATIIAILAETGSIGIAAYILWVISILLICGLALRSPGTFINNGVYGTAISLTLINMLLMDFYTEASFLPYMNCFLAFLLGYIREKRATYTLHDKTSCPEFA